MNTLDEKEMPEKTLLCVLGRSPAILTETLYGLVHKDEPFIPNKIEVITTKIGAEQCKLALFKDNGGWFYKFCKEYGIEGIQFTESDIYCIKDSEGQDIEDIRNAEDNTALANLITSRIQYHTQLNSELHVSLAGGRKTMGYYAGYILSIFGRPKDRLSHVLVDSKFEGLKNFFYPTKSTNPIQGHDGNLLDTKKARVELADIPFIRLRGALDKKLITGKLSFEEIIKRMEETISGPPKITLIRKENALLINNQEIKLKPIDFIFYDWVASKSNKLEVPLTENNCDEIDKKDFMDFIHNHHEMNISSRSLESLSKALAHSFISERRNSISQKLKSVLGIKSKNYDLVYEKKKDLRHVSGTLELNIKPENISIK